jgi:hypothetical protein
MLNLKMVLVEPSRVEIIYQVTKRTQARGSLLDRLHHPHGVTFKDNLLETQLNAQIYTLLQSHGLRIGWVSDIRYRFGQRCLDSPKLIRNNHPTPIRLETLHTAASQLCLNM